MLLVGAMSISPLDTREPRMVPELLGQAAVTSLSQAQGKGAPFRSRAALPSAARLARCPPARCQAKFFAISRSTPASRNALSPPAACASLQPSGPCAQDRSIPKDPHLTLLILAGPS